LAMAKSRKRTAPPPNGNEDRKTIIKKSDLEGTD